MHPALTPAAELEAGDCRRGAVSGSSLTHGPFAAPGLHMQTPVADHPTVAIEDHGEGGSVLVCSGGQGLRLSLVTPILDRLGVEIESFESKAVASASGQKQTTTRYVIHDGSGHRLRGLLLAQLIEGLQKELHVEEVAYHRTQPVDAAGRAEQERRAAAGQHAPAPGAKQAPGDAARHAAGPMQQHAASPHGDDAADEHDAKQGYQRPRQLPKTVSWAPGTPFSPAASGDLPDQSELSISTADSPQHGRRTDSPQTLPSGAEDRPDLSPNDCTSQTSQELPALQPWARHPAAEQQGSPFMRAAAAAQAVGSPAASPASGGGSPRPLSSIPSEEPEGSSSWWGCISPQDPVSLIMSKPLRWISQEKNLGEARRLMTNWGISSLMVDTGTAQPGFLTMRGFLNVSFSKSLKKTQVKDVMTQPVIHVTPDTGIEDCLVVMQSTEQKVRRVAIFDPRLFDVNDPDTWNSSWVGMVSDTDIFCCLGQPKRNEGGVGAGAGAGAPAQRDASRAGQSLSTCSLAPSASSRSTVSSVRLPQYSGGISTEDRYRTAAALWELDFAELEIIRKIGEGSFGEVVLANFRGTKVAVKRLRGFDTTEEGAPSSTIQPVLNQFFEREIEILATIRHPNVVNFIGACHTPPNIALVTEFCARGSLDTLLHKSSLQLDLVKRVEIALDIARGMSALHAQKPPIIHRDMKAANLLVSARLEVKVADFGLSRIKDHAQLVNSRAGLEGTVEYCAPEVLRGEPYTEKCDVYSYGVVCWELFNRQRPYADADIPIFLLMISLGNGNLRLPPLSEAVSSAGLVRLWERCMAWQPHERPSFREVLHALENEYKVVRGKAAAVPRSDSAWCMAGKDAEPDDDAVGAPPRAPSPHAPCSPLMRPLQPRPLAHDASPAPFHPPPPPPPPPPPARLPVLAGVTPLHAPPLAETKPRALSRRMNRSTSTPVPEQLWFDSEGNIIELPHGADADSTHPVVGSLDGGDDAGSSRQASIAPPDGLGAAAAGGEAGQAPAPDTATSAVAAGGAAAAGAGPVMSAFADPFSPFGAYPAFDDATDETSSSAAATAAEEEEPQAPAELEEEESGLVAGQLRLQASRGLAATEDGDASHEPAAALAAPAAGGAQQWFSPFATASELAAPRDEELELEEQGAGAEHFATSASESLSPVLSLPCSPSHSSFHSSCPAVPYSPPHSPLRSPSPSPPPSPPPFSPSQPLHPMLRLRRGPTVACPLASFGSDGLVVLSPEDTSGAHAGFACESPCLSPQAESTLHTTAWVVI